jgi:hypothetical protein
MREGSRVGAALLKKRLLTPPLVRESSRSLLPSFLGGGGGGGGGSLGAGDTLSGVVLNAAMAARIAEVATSVRNTRAHGANFRNLLFYGPPGTGKTLVAKRLARSSGLDFAVMSGGDVGPLGKDAVTELHRLLDWASRSPKGCVLFIDEADAFLASRSRTAMSEEQRNAHRRDDRRRTAAGGPHVKRERGLEPRGAAIARPHLVGAQIHHLDGRGGSRGRRRPGEGEGAGENAGEAEHPKKVERSFTGVTLKLFRGPCPPPPRSPTNSPFLSSWKTSPGNSC